MGNCSTGEKGRCVWWSAPRAGGALCPGRALCPGGALRPGCVLYSGGAHVAYQNAHDKRAAKLRVSQQAWETAWERRGSGFDSCAKQWRLFADIMNDVGASAPSNSLPTVPLSLSFGQTARPQYLNSLPTVPLPLVRPACSSAPSQQPAIFPPSPPVRAACSSAPSRQPGTRPPPSPHGPPARPHQHFRHRLL
eukprot:359148-Chlamydomonas_euryale.AAC.1